MYKLDLFSRQTEFPSRGTDPVPSSPEDTLENFFSVDLTWSLSLSHGHGFFHVKFWLPGGTSVNTNYHCKTLFWSTKSSPHMAVHQHSGPSAQLSISTAVHQHSDGEVKLRNRAASGTKSQVLAQPFLLFIFTEADSKRTLLCEAEYWKGIQLLHNSTGWWSHTPLISAPGRQEQADLSVWGLLGLPSEFSARQSCIVRSHLQKGGKPKVYIIQSQLFFFRSQNDSTVFCIKTNRSTKER